MTRVQMANLASIAQFMDVTGASEEAAKFFLESSGGVVDQAVDQYFATGGDFTAVQAMQQEQIAEPEPAAPAGASTAVLLALLHYHAHTLQGTTNFYLSRENALPVLRGGQAQAHSCFVPHLGSSYLKRGSA